MVTSCNGEYVIKHRKSTIKVLAKEHPLAGEGLIEKMYNSFMWNIDDPNERDIGRFIAHAHIFLKVNKDRFIKPYEGMFV